jgi:hypothetical protein
MRQSMSNITGTTPSLWVISPEMKNVLLSWSSGATTRASRQRALRCHNERRKIGSKQTHTLLCTMFPIHLHGLLTDLEASGQAHIASFQPHGRSFKVHMVDEFVSTLLPKCVLSCALPQTACRIPNSYLCSFSWFQQSKYASFQRQLNIYGFKRITCKFRSLLDDASALYLASGFSNKTFSLSRPRQECLLPQGLFAGPTHIGEQDYTVCRQG